MQEHVHILTFVPQNSFFNAINKMLDFHCTIWWGSKTRKKLVVNQATSKNVNLIAYLIYHTTGRNKLSIPKTLKVFITGKSKNQYLKLYLFILVIYLKIIIRQVAGKIQIIWKHDYQIEWKMNMTTKSSTSYTWEHAFLKKYYSLCINMGTVINSNIIRIKWIIEKLPQSPRLHFECVYKRERERESQRLWD